jgi:hypothetical protein
MIDQTISHYRIVEKFRAGLARFQREAQRRAHESRTCTEGCVGVGGVDFLAWCLSADDVSMAERVAMAA